jgi:O-antigen ligase/tetratricopeptide (TPR) repeat protein
MQTRLSIFCDQLIEAGWLVSVIVIPLYFNIYSALIFEMDKTCLLRSIALLMTLAWVIGALERRKNGGEREAETGLAQRVVNFLTRPLVLPALMLAGVYLLTSLTSVWPRASFWGSYIRLQGAYTTISYIVIFFLILWILRTQEQVERLVTLIVLTSLPVSLYALAQHYGLDPIPWGVSVAERVTSSLGNAISIGAYLIMTVPLTMRQCIKSFSNLRAGPEQRAPNSISTVLYLLTLVAQLIAIVFAQSRGPFLGLAGGLFFFLLLWAILKNRMGLGLAVIILATVFGLLLIILNLPHTPLDTIKTLPYVGRLSTIAKTRTFETRALIWQGAINMSRADPVRTVIGYGPETMLVTYQPYLLPALFELEGPGRAPDRCHNATLDALITTGLIGMAAYLFLFGSVFYYGLKWLGLITSPRQRNLFIALSTAGGVLGVGIPWYLERTLRFAAVGIPVGMLVALTIYLAPCLFRGRKEKIEHGDNPMLLIALFAAIVAHFVEIQTGIPITPTRTYFWVYAALMTVVGLSIQGECVLAPLATRPAPAARSRSQQGRKRKKSRRVTRRQRGFRIEHLLCSPILTYALSAGLLVATVGFSLINVTFDLSIVAFLLLVWSLAGAVVIAKTIKPDGDGWIASLISYATVSLVLCLLLLLVHAVSRPPSSDPARIVIVHYLCLGLSIAAIAASLLGDVSLPYLLWHKANWWLYAGLVVAVTLLIIVTNLNVAMADVYFKVGEAMRGYENWDASIAFYERAVKFAPGQDHYHLWLGKAYLERAMVDADYRTVWLQEAQEAMERAQEIDPLNSEPYAFMGELHQYRASVANDPREVTESLETALAYYQQAMGRNPLVEGERLKWHRMRAHHSLAEVYADTGRIEKAIEAAEAARDLASGDERAELEVFIAALESRMK